MLRVGMTNPPYILEHLEEMSKILNHPRVYSFLHVPVQSGSDTILGEMKREYCRKDFEHVVNFLRERVSGLTIATDIICGFPGETEQDFEETMTLCEKYKFPSLFINQFFPRPGTPAARMTRIPANLVKTRTKRLTDLFNSYEPYENRVGEHYNVLVTEISHDRKHYVGHNKFYEQILLPMVDNLLGKAVQVKIVSTTKFSMHGEIIDPEEEWQQGAKKVETLKNGIVKNGYATQDVPAGIPNDGNVAKQSYLGYALIALFLALVYRFIWKVLQDL